jgi:HrpA-like RNA helicase
VDDGGELTPLGQHLAELPVDARLGKMILYGAIFGCADPVLTIAAAMSHRSPFAAPIDKRDQVRGQAVSSKETRGISGRMRSRCAAGVDWFWRSSGRHTRQHAI